MPLPTHPFNQCPAKRGRCFPGELIFGSIEWAQRLSELAREALTGRHGADVIAEGESFYGFDPLPHRGPAVSNALIEELRDEELE